MLARPAQKARTQVAPLRYGLLNCFPDLVDCRHLVLPFDVFLTLAVGTPPMGELALQAGSGSWTKRRLQET